jgi:hypothetical protein
MDTVMFHTGEWPEFLECTFKQFRLFNPLANVYFLTDRRHLDNSLFKKYNILPFNKDLFYSDKISQFELIFNYGKNDFWTVTATRLIYIENFMQCLGLTDVYHFENDVLIYYGLKEHDEKFRSLYNNLAITIGGEIVAMTGFMFIKHYEALSRMTKYFIDLLDVYGISGIIEKYHIPMVNEMFLMRQFGIDYPDQLRTLPTMPTGEFSENYPVFNSLFDPASYGQFVGGTRSEGPGAKPQDHYIGRWLTANPDHNVIWKIEEGRKIPYLKYDNEIKINNLHIHSKNLHKYIS